MKYKRSALPRLPAISLPRPSYGGNGDVAALLDLQKSPPNTHHPNVCGNLVDIIWNKETIDVDGGASEIGSDTDNGLGCASR